MTDVGSLTSFSKGKPIESVWEETEDAHQSIINSIHAQPAFRQGYTSPDEAIIATFQTPLEVYEHIGIVQIWIFQWCDSTADEERPCCVCVRPT